jgi:hydrogenase maturation factor
VEVEDIDAARSRASLLAYDGPELTAGEWVSVHSGYVLAHVDGEEAAKVKEDILRAQRESSERGASR